MNEPINRDLKSRIRKVEDIESGMGERDRCSGGEDEHILRATTGRNIPTRQPAHLHNTRNRRFGDCNPGHSDRRNTFAINSYRRPRAAQPARFQFLHHQPPGFCYSSLSYPG